MNNKRGFIVLVVIFVIASAVALYISYQVDKSDSFVCFGENCVSVEVVSTAAEMTKGLMGRESLGDNEGMLFDFGNAGNYSFWMKNTLIPLDMIWINNGTVVYVVQANPCSEEPCEVFTPNADADYVLEVNQGYTNEHGIEVGSEVEIRR